MGPYQALLNRVRLVRRRWRTQLIMKGIAVFLVCAVAFLSLGVWGAELIGFKPAAVWLLRLITGGVVIFAAVRFLILPFRRRIPDIQIARYVEERFPQLQDRLVTAVEFGGNPAISPGLIDLLIRDALDKTSRVDLAVFRNRKRLGLYAAAASSALLILLALMSWGPSFFHYGFDRLYIPWTETASAAARTMIVTPGNRELPKGADQEIRVRLVGFDAPEVRLYSSPISAEVWKPASMEPESRGSGFAYLLVDVESSLRYYAEAKGVRSSIYELTVTDLPRVEKISVRYVFPSYTGMEPQLVEKEGDISALKGTRVDIMVRLNKPAARARLLLADRSTISLRPSANQEYTTSLTLSSSGSYVVEAETGGSKWHVASSEYEIEALEDAPPKIVISKPMRDVRSTNVEEVFTELKAEDDIGVGKVELHYSVNGGAEKTLPLSRGGPNQTAVVAPHTFFLEDFKLQAGDMVAYYGKAFDNNTVSGPGTSSSDIYFIQVRPFDQKYTQSQQAGGGGGGEGEGGQEALSKQQKDVISATFKLIRDKDKLDSKEYPEGLKSLSLIQGRLQLQAQGLLDRLKRRGAIEVSRDFARLGEYLGAAILEMGKAAASLGAQRPAEALPDEQKALQQLLRAESLFREIQVSFAAQMGGGSGNQSSAEDLADLFELELNKLKNQYETIQRGEQQARDQKLDEAMERLKELARRQQQLNERNRNLAMRGGGSASGSAGSGQSQQQLAEEAERLQRQLQRLSRERNSPELNRVGSRLEQAIQEMKKAQDESRRNNATEAGAPGARALQQLEDARQALARGQQAGLSRGLEQAAEESRGMVEEQSRIQEGVSKLTQERSQAGTPSFQQKQKDLIERKSLLADRVKNLGKKIDDLSGIARNTERETASRLNDAGSIIRDKRLPERILSGNQMIENGYLDFIKAREDYVRAALEDLKQQIDSARGAVGQTREGKLGEAANRIRQLADGLESMRQRVQSKGAGQTGSRQAGSQRDSGQPGSDSGGQSRDQRGQGRDASQPGGEPRGDSGRPAFDGSGRIADATGPPTGTGRPGDEDPRQLRRELQERSLEARELRRLLDRNPSHLQNLEKVLESLRAAENAPSASEAELLSRLKAAIDLLQGVDRDLRRELSQLAQKDGYLYVEDNEAPGAYKKLVEEYYKALARIKP